MKSSLAIPKFWNVNPPSPLFKMYQTLFEGRKTIKSALLSMSVSRASRRLTWPDTKVTKSRANTAIKPVLPLAVKTFLILVFLLLDPQRFKQIAAIDQEG